MPVESVMRNKAAVERARLSQGSWLAVIGLLLGWHHGSLGGAAESVDYARDVRPLLQHKCYACHGPVKQESGLRLDAGLLVHQGGDNGAVIAPHDSASSALIERVSSADATARMPPIGSPLSADQVNILRQWIDRGALYPADERVAPTAESHWSFQPVRDASVPEVTHRDWPINAIDHFILAGLEQRGWEPNRPTEPHALVRRAYLDLTGLPPTIAEQDAFLQSANQETYERLIRDLLERDSYGERYARHWLDLVRYADSNGYERDAAKPEVWRYRDYVIRAFNRDKRFDDFVVEQLAGDEMPGATSDSVLATGFNRLGPWDDEPANVELDRYDQLDDLVSTTSQVFLGLTLGCARCHDHKFDPLTQRDYYQLVAVFSPLSRPRDGRTELTRFAAPPRLAAELHGPDVPQGYFLVELQPSGPATHVLVRGSPANPGEPVDPGVPALLARKQPQFLPPDELTTRRRLSLARWLANADHPLTARVIVNRVWQWHFGEGLVRTPNDFGLMGDRPTHPELLDYLAHWFVHDGQWSLKRLHVLIMSSRTYQMSRQAHADYAQVDPENRLHWRRSYQRLDVEAIRDSTLAISGQLDRTMFGPPMYPFIPAEALLSHADKTSIWPEYDERAAARRTIYAFVKRSLLVPMLEVLDFCDTTRSVAQRNVTTVPTQALTLYNGEFVNRQAQHLAERLGREASPQIDDQIDLTWRLALCRLPTSSERDAARASVLENERELGGQTRDAGTPEELRLRAMQQLCRVVLNLNEFVYPD